MQLLRIIPIRIKVDLHLTFKATGPLQGDLLLLTTKSQESPDTHLIYLRRMKG